MNFCLAAVLAVMLSGVLPGAPAHGREVMHKSLDAYLDARLGTDAVLISGEESTNRGPAENTEAQAPGRMVEISPTATPAGAKPPLGIDLPASFTGDLKCPECGNVRYRLNLWSDQVFALRRRWLDTRQTRDSIGRWSTESEGRILVLWDGEGEMRFEVRPATRLRLLGPGGVEPSDPEDAELTGEPGVTPEELRLPLRGTVSFLAENARITECLTGRNYPLASDEDFDTLEAAYLAAGVAQGTPLMMSFDGAITQRPLDTGKGSETVVSVRHFTGVWPDETCEQAKSDAGLENTSWRIVRLGKTDIAAKGGREPYLLLKEEESSFVATVGCNQLVGQFVRQGDRLGFKPGASTMMACPPPLDDWEARLTAALTQTSSWQVNGQALELLDDSGMQIALFEAMPAP